MKTALTFGEVLEAHQKGLAAQNAVANSFCDGYFLMLSPLATKLRSSILENGFSLREAGPGLETDLYYQVGNFLWKHQYEKREVLFCNSYSSYVELARESHRIAELNAEFISVSLLYRSNRLFQNSARFIAFSRFHKTPFFEKNSSSSIREWLNLHLATEAVVLSLQKFATIVKKSDLNLFVANVNCQNPSLYPKDFNTVLQQRMEVGPELVFIELAKAYYRVLAASLSGWKACAFLTQTFSDPPESQLSNNMAAIAEDLFGERTSKDYMKLNLYSLGFPAGTPEEDLPASSTDFCGQATEVIQQSYRLFISEIMK